MSSCVVNVSQWSVDQTMFNVQRLFFLVQVSSVPALQQCDSSCAGKLRYSPLHPDARLSTDHRGLGYLLYSAVRYKLNRTIQSFSQSLRFVDCPNQADLDMPDLFDTPLDSPDTDIEVLSSGALSRQYSRDAATSTVSIQGSGNHYHACASDEYEDVGFDPSILPPPDPWIDSVSDDPLDVNFNSSAILEVCGSRFSGVTTASRTEQLELSSDIQISVMNYCCFHDVHRLLRRINTLTIQLFEEGMNKVHTMN